MTRRGLERYVTQPKRVAKASELAKLEERRIKLRDENARIISQLVEVDLRIAWLKEQAEKAAK